MSYREWVFVLGGPFVGIALLITGLDAGSWIQILGGALILIPSVAFDIRLILALWKGRGDLERAKHWSGD